MASEFGLINKGICEEDMVSASTISSKCALERVGNVFADHKGHKAFVKRTSDQLAKAAGYR